MVVDREQINNLALQRYEHYRNLTIAGHKVVCPYAINFFTSNLRELMSQANASKDVINTAAKAYKDRVVDYGWYRGKGTPEQIVQAATEIAQRKQYNLPQSSPEGIAEFMKLFGLGIDCSGLVFNLLHYAFSECNELDQFIDSFTWPSSSQAGVDYAGASFLAEHSTKLSNLDDIKPLDFVFFKIDDRYPHIAILLNDGID